MALTFEKIPAYDYDLSRQQVWLVTRGDCVLGILECLCGVWKAYSGSDFSCKSLGERASRRAAIAAIKKAAANL